MEYVGMTRNGLNEKSSMTEIQVRYACLSTKFVEKFWGVSVWTAGDDFNELAVTAGIGKKEDTGGVIQALDCQEVFTQVTKA